MRLIARLIVRLADLLEAEGRALRKSVVKVSVALSLALAAGLIAVAGVSLLGWALFAALRYGVGAPAAAAICGALLLATSTWAFLIAHRMGR